MPSRIISDTSPSSIEHDRANVLYAAVRLTEAEAAYRRALALRPDFVEAWNNLGNALRGLGRLVDAEAAYRRAVELRPDCAAFQANLAHVLDFQGRQPEAVEHFRRAAELGPDGAAAHSHMLRCLQYIPGVTPPQLAVAHAEWDARHAVPLSATWRPFGNDPSADRVLRLGFVSADFGFHPVGRLLAHVLEDLRGQPCATVCYSERSQRDSLTNRLAAAATLWRDVHGVSDEQLAEQVRADRIDILFDLAGHTANNRLLVFARKPAPVQITWLGYVGTTGLSAMDCLLADALLVPAGSEAAYREQVIRLPDGYACYEAPADAPEVGPLPATAAGHITFGCFNNSVKITPPVVALWAEILKRVPGSRLFLKYGWFGSEDIRRQFRERFAAHGIGSERLEMEGWSAHAHFLACHQRVDLALDTFPYSGGMTTCDALWMGVPVITWPGATFASRHSLSHLTNAGITETIVASPDEYRERAVRLAHNRDGLAALRAGLRERMRRSPLCDRQRFAANLLQTLREVWRRRHTA